MNEPLTVPMPATPPTPRRAAVQRGPLHRVAVALVLALAFLSGSFAARNADLWRHLATGRAIAVDNLPFGSEPFAYSVERWVNPSWLFDLMVFSVYEQYGGPALVIVKALLVAILASVLMKIRRA